jgi:hypothetical protein
MDFDKLIKKIFGGGDNSSSLNKGSISSIEEYVEVPVHIHDDSNVIKIKVCELEDYRDATDIAVLVEAGYLVLANTIHLERDIDEDYAKLLAYLRDKLSECGGNMVRVGDEKILVIPSNVVIEKLVKEPETSKTNSQSIGESIEEYNEEYSKEENK